MEPRLRGSQRNSERVRDLWQRQVEVMLKNDERASFRLEAAEAAVELVAIHHAGSAVMARREIKVGDIDFEAVAPDAARFIDARAIQESVEPGVELVRVPQGGEVSPRADEGFLYRILRLVGIAQDEPGGSVQPGDRGGRELGKGVMIAPPRSIHEVLLHVASWLRHGTCGRAQ